MEPDPSDSLAEWSPWRAFAEAAAMAPRLPGVYIYMARDDAQVVYVGMAGERKGRGIQPGAQRAAYPSSLVQAERACPVQHRLGMLA